MKVNIANTDLEPLSRLGLGTVGAGTKWSGAEAGRIFDTYVGCGGNVIDTARVYSVIADSEPTIGAWLRRSRKRHQVMIVSKGGHPEIKSWPPDMHAFRLSREEMTADLDASLAALGTDYIDIYLYHRDDPKRSVEELVETMENFVRQGKIRYYGVSNWTLDRIQAAQDYAASRGLRGFVMNQALFNAGSDHMPAPSDDTLVKVDTQMQIYHRNLQNSSMDILCAGFSGNCGGFFQQYLKGGADAVRDKTYLTPENIKKAEQIHADASANGTTILQEVLSFYRKTDFPCIGLFGPRDAAGIAEAMKGF